MAHRGSTAQRRRHARRLARRRQDALVAGAVGGTYPLGDRAEAWDGGAAEKSYDLPGDAPCYMWKDPSGDPASGSSYKLPFVAKSGGSKHAVWKAITSIAAILQGGRGGVQIPAADKDAVKSKVAGYYAKARTAYKDPNIKVPWQAAQEAVVALAAEKGWEIHEVPDDALVGEKASEWLRGAWASSDEHYAELVAEYDRAAVHALAYAEVGDDTSDAYHFAVIALTSDLSGAFAPNTMPCANCDHAAELHSGPSNNGQCEYASCSCMSYVTPKHDDEGGDDKQPPIKSSAESEEFATKPDDEDEEDDGEKPGDKKDDEEPDDDEDDVMEKRRQAAKKRSAALDEAIEAAIALADEEGQTLRFVLSDFRTITADGEVTDPETQPLFTGGSQWVATLCPEGTATEDGRIFAPGSITWRELPLSLLGMIETQQGHDGAQVCGRIDNIWREDATGLIRGSGEFDSGEYGSMIARMVGDETLRGISVDIAPIKVEVAKRVDVVDENGNWIEKAAEDESDEDDKESPSLLDLLFGDDDMLTVVQEGVIGAATVVPFPAFAVANIEIANSLAASDRSGMIWTVTTQAGWTVTARLTPAPEGEEAPAPALTASAAGIAPMAPPADWFEDPALEELTPLTVSEDGRIYGHAAAWGTCHTGIPGTCTTAPTSETDYAYFHLKEVLCDDGSRVPVGTITMDAGHADLELGRAAATDHYDNTATAAADVRVGEDDFGIWVSGSIRPDLDEMSARRLRGATVSGDWRAVRLSDGTQNRELIALLAVNVPGFPVPRPQALVASANDTGIVITAQIAAGMHAGQEGVTLLQKRQAEAVAMSDEFAELGRALES